MTLGAVQEMPFAWERNIPIVPKDFTITLANDSFKAIGADTDVKSWVTNIAPGLSARTAGAVLEGGTELTLTVSGAATGTRTAPLLITIPASSLTRREAGDLAASLNSEAVFYIVDPNATLPRVAGDTTYDTTTVIGTKNRLR
jgi:hypothetical protein